MTKIVVTLKRKNKFFKLIFFKSTMLEAYAYFINTNF